MCNQHLPTNFLQHNTKKTLILHKVKAHAGNINNDRADALAKDDRTSTHRININHRALPNNIQIIWDDQNINIDRLQYTSRYLQRTKILSLAFTRVLPHDQTSNIQQIN
ncbi:hypothetical protein RclHR1_04790001 [Rhizophagus clarus]|uniref:Uncharacterized protein n=1 Tax=Rhizophagus clarus TaxID=94130 RepID=A0A2Z6S1W8_9GLOM|nr:hypothetical protein RclHR1_04790001 [Rhizophagus clarus]GES95897.1 hypothetical protein GLOIN_2v1474050 [Rhizophagus clarus]